jgi:hypothetical protein
MPRRRPFPAIRRILNILQKNPQTLLKSTRSLAFSHKKFNEKNLGFYNNQPAVYASQWACLPQWAKNGPRTSLPYLIVLSFLQKPYISQRTYKTKQKT